MYRQALLAAVLLTGATEPPPSTGRIEGTVRDSAGAPVANAQVIVVSRPWTAMSDSAGHYRLADIPAGRYTSALRRWDTGARRWPTCGVTAGAATRLDLTLARSPVEQQPPRDEASAVAGVAKRAEADWRAMSREALAAPQNANGQWYPAAEPMNTENYAVIEESRFLPAGTNPLSTFSIDVDAALRQRAALPHDGAAAAEGRRAHRGAGQLLPLRLPRARRRATRSRHAPTSRRRRGRRSTGCCASAFKGRAIDTARAAAEQPGVPDRRLGLDAAARQAAAGEAGVPRCWSTSFARRTAWRSWCTRARPGWCCRSTPGADKATILAALDRLEAGGSTAGGAGHPARLRGRAASTTSRGGNNRVILATDGDFNVGVTSDAASWCG